jgi:hypothetical protein
MTRLSPAYLLTAGQTRLENAMLPFKVLADDSGRALSVCESVRPGWSSGHFCTGTTLWTRGSS